MTSAEQQGHANRRQGFYGECVVQAIAASAGLRVSKEQPEPEGIDLAITHVRPSGIPKRQRIEVQVKSRSKPKLIGDDFHIPLTAKAYRELNGRLGVDFDVPRFLILVVVPGHFNEYCVPWDHDHLRFRNHAYWLDLMGQADLPEGQASTTVSVPRCNVLTPKDLVALVCGGNHEEASTWMSA